MEDARTTPNTLLTFEEMLSESSEEYDGNSEEDESDESWVCPDVSCWPHQNK